MNIAIESRADAGPSSARGSPANAALVLIAVALFSSIAFAADAMPFVAGAFALLMAAAVALRAIDALHLALLGAALACIMLFPALRVLSLPMLLTVVVYAAVVFAAAPLRRSVDWLRRGDWNLGAAIAVVVIAAVASSALLAWHAMVQPDLSQTNSMVARTPFVALAAAAIGIPLVNALIEEVVFRGAMMSALSRVSSRPWVVNAVQALSFGLLHKDGIPNGAWGIALATVYALMLGALRQRTGGLFAPWLAHVVADITIFVIVVRLA